MLISARANMERNIFFIIFILFVFSFSPLNESLEEKINNNETYSLIDTSSETVDLSLYKKIMLCVCNATTIYQPVYLDLDIIPNGLTYLVAWVTSSDNVTLNLSTGAISSVGMGYKLFGIRR